jgi:hypothetical protein
MNRAILLPIFLALSCASGTPSPAQQGEVGLYETRLQECIAEAKLMDAGAREKIASYKACADKADWRDAQ